MLLMPSTTRRLSLPNRTPRFVNETRSTGTFGAPLFMFRIRPRMKDFPCQRPFMRGAAFEKKIGSPANCRAVQGYYFSSLPKKSSVARYARIQLFHMRNP